MVKFSGASRKCFVVVVVAIFSKHWWFQTKQFIRLVEFIKLYKLNPLEIFLFSLFTELALNSEIQMPYYWVNCYFNTHDLYKPVALSHFITAIESTLTQTIFL